MGKQTNKWHFVKIPNNNCLFVYRKQPNVVLIVMDCHVFVIMDYNHGMKCLKRNTTWWSVRAYSLLHVQSIHQLPPPCGDHDDSHESHEDHRNLRRGCRGA